MNELKEKFNMDDLKNVFEENFLKTLSTEFLNCIVSFDPIDEFIEGGADKKEILQKIRSLKPVNMGFEKLFLDFSFVKGNESLLMIEKDIEKEIKLAFNRDCRSLVHDSKQLIQLFKDFKCLKEIDIGNILKMEERNLKFFESKISQIMKLYKSICEDEKSPDINDHYEFLKFFVEYFPSKKELKEELDIYRQISEENKRFSEIKLKVEEKKTIFLNLCEENELGEAKICFNVLKAFINNLEDIYQEKLKLDLDELWKINILSKEVIPQHQQEHQNSVMDNEKRNQERDFSEIIFRKEPNNDFANKENLEINLKKSKKNEVANNENLEIHKKDQILKKEEKKKKLLARMHNYIIFFCHLTIITISYLFSTFSSFDHPLTVSDDQIIQLFKENKLDDPRLKDNLDFLFNLSKISKGHEEFNLKSKHFFQHKIWELENLTNTSIISKKINESSVIEIVRLLKASKQLDHHFSFNQEIIENARNEIFLETRKDLIVLKNISKYLKTKKNYSLLNDLFLNDHDIGYVLFKEEIKKNLATFLKSFKSDLLGKIKAIYEKETNSSKYFLLIKNQIKTIEKFIKLMNEKIIEELKIKKIRITIEKAIEEESTTYFKKKEHEIEKLIQSENFCRTNEVHLDLIKFMENLKLFYDIKSIRLIVQEIEKKISTMMNEIISLYINKSPNKYFENSPKIFLPKLKCTGNPYNIQIKKSIETYKKIINDKWKRIKTNKSLNLTSLLELKNNLVFVPDHIASSFREKVNNKETIIRIQVKTMKENFLTKIKNFENRTDEISSGIEKFKRFDILEEIRPFLENKLSEKLNNLTNDNGNEFDILNKIRFLTDKTKAFQEFNANFIPKKWTSFKSGKVNIIKQNYKVIISKFLSFKSYIPNFEKVSEQKMLDSSLEIWKTDKFLILTDLIQLRKENLIENVFDYLPDLLHDFDDFLLDLNKIISNINSFDNFPSFAKLFKYDEIIKIVRKAQNITIITTKLNNYIHKMKLFGLKNVETLEKTLKEGKSSENMISDISIHFNSSAKICFNPIINNETSDFEYYRINYYQTVNSSVQMLKKAEKLLNLHSSPPINYEICKKHLMNQLKNLTVTINNKLNGKNVTSESELDLNLFYNNLESFNNHLIKVDGLQDILNKMQGKLKDLLVNQYETCLKNLSLQNVALSLKMMQKISVKVFNLTALAENYINLILDHFITEKGQYQFAMLRPFLNDVWGQYLIQKNKYFKESSIENFNRKTQTYNIDYVLEKLEGTNINKTDLLRAYQYFQNQMNTTLEINLFSPEKLEILSKKTQKLAKLIQYNLTKNNGSLNSEIKQSLTSLLAHVFAIWTCEHSLSDFFKSQGLESEKKNYFNFLIRPHPAQIIAIIRALSIGSNDSNFSNHLSEILSGEGKSVTLAILGSVFALIGYDVNVAIYSEYLSQRDVNEYLKLFQRLGIKQFINYGTFTQLCENFINRHFDIREKVSEILKHNVYHFKKNDSSYSQRSNILLIDEVDVFFSKEFFGNIYSPILRLENGYISHFFDFIWKSRDLPTFSIVTIKNSIEFKNVVSLYKNWEDLIEDQLKYIFNDLKKFRDHEYIIKNEMIAYKEQNNIIFNKIVGYKTLFAYYLEFEKGEIPFKSIQKQKYLTIFAGAFSYAEVPLNFDLIMGVTGTLKNLVDVQKRLLREKYNLHNYTILPSVYGKRNFVFDEKSDVHVYSKKEFYKELCDEIENQRKNVRPILIFFESETNITEFLNSQEASPFKSNIQKLTELASNSERENLITSATAAKKITLLTRVMGRGLDFRCFDENINKIGGIHVIQTFFSKDPSENIQIKRRTARQGDKGSFSMILLDIDLIPFNILQSEFNSKDIELNQLLQKRSSKFLSEELNGNYLMMENATLMHKETLEFMKNIELDRKANIQDYLKKNNKFRGNGKERLHIMVIVDSSGSMASKDVLPEDMQNFLPNRFGAVLESLDRALNKINKEFSNNVFFTYAYFSEICRIFIESEVLSADIVKRRRLNDYHFGSGTNFNEAIATGIELLKKYSEDYLIFLFLSDGESNTNINILQNLKDVTEKVNSKSYVIGIAEDNEELKKIASFSNEGKYQSIHKLVELQEYLFNEVVDKIGYGNNQFYN